MGAVFPRRGPPSPEPPWAGPPDRLALHVRFYAQDPAGIWRADLTRGHVVLGVREEGARDISDLMADPTGAILDPVRVRDGVQGAAKPGVLVWEAPRGRTSSVHFIRAPLYPETVHLGDRFGLWTAGGFVGGVPQHWSYGAGLSNAWITKIHASRNPVEVKPRWCGPSRLVPTPYGFVVPERDHRFVHDFLAFGDLLAAFKRHFPIQGRLGNAMIRAKKKLEEPTTYKLWIEEMGRALAAPKGGMATYIVENMMKTVELTLASREPWRAQGALDALHEIARTNAQAEAALVGQLEGIQATFGITDGKVPIPTFVPTKQPTPADIANAHAQAALYLEDC